VEVALADDGQVQAVPPLLAATAAQTVTIPYTFTVIDFSGSGAMSLPPVDFSSIAFINQAGSIAVTIFSLLDQYAILGIFVVILLGVSTIFWIHSVVTGRSSVVQLNREQFVTSAANLYYQRVSSDLDTEIGASESLAASPDTPIEERTRIRDVVIPGLQSQRKSAKETSLKWKQGARAFKKAKNIGKDFRL
jgi:hypothetical protein